MVVYSKYLACGVTFDPSSNLDPFSFFGVTVLLTENSTWILFVSMVYQYSVSALTSWFVFMFWLCLLCYLCCLVANL